MIGTYVLTTNVTQVTGLDVQQLTCFHTADRACMLLSGILFGVDFTPVLWYKNSYKIEQLGNSFNVM